MVIVVSFIGVGDMRVNLRGSDGAMPKKALNEANIRSVFQKVRGKAMPQGMN
jgi:hypothetical protein